MVNHNNPDRYGVSSEALKAGAVVIVWMCPFDVTWQHERSERSEGEA